MWNKANLMHFVQGYYSLPVTLLVAYFAICNGVNSGKVFEQIAMRLT